MVRLALALALVAACSIPDVTFHSGDDPGPDAGTDGAPAREVIARWTLTHRQTNTRFGCPGSATTSKVQVNAWDPNTLLVSYMTQEFPVSCATGQATIMLPPGTYLAHMLIQDSSGTNLGVSDFQFFDVTQTSATIDLAFYDDAGFFLFTWGLIDHAGGAAVTCATAGISSAGWIELVSTESGGQSYLDKFACTDHAGSTQGLPAGTYTFMVRGREAGTAATTTVAPPGRNLPVNSVIAFDTDVIVPVH